MSKGYYTITRVTDNGPYITQLMLPVGKTVAAGAVAKDNFTVHVDRLDDQGNILMLAKNWMSTEMVASTGELSIRDAYPSDLKGNRLASGQFITLDLDYGPIYSLSAEISCIGPFNTYIRTHHTITQKTAIAADDGAVEPAVYDWKLDAFRPDLEGWRNATSHDEKCPLNYGYYVPQAKGGKHPLIIWLHGAGEGGTDATIAYTGNKATAFAGERMQNLAGGAYVLCPQTPTFWMDDGSGQISESGKTIYLDAVKACIDEFIALNEAGIDTSRIYVGGDSNGGFMTMHLILAYPDFFAAAFPCCEALIDSYITDEKLTGIKDMPIWFVHAKNDPIVQPERFVLPTYKRLMAMGASDCHFTFWDNVKDLHGEFKNEKGEPFEYLGHFVWIPTYNDDNKVDFDGQPVLVNDKPATLFEWLVSKKRTAR